MAERVIGFRLGDELIEALDIYGAATVRNRSQVIELAIRAFLASPEASAVIQAEREKGTKTGEG